MADGGQKLAKLLTTLQAGRAFAALAVVMHHAAISTGAFVAPLPVWANEVLSRGYLGVDFFFVLSGFIIYYTTALTPRATSSAPPFVVQRLSRIFVPYLPVGIGLAIAYLALPGLSGSDREWSLLASLTLLPGDLPPALSVAWTLQHELIFYCLFAGLLATNRIAVGMATWAAAIGIGWLLGLSSAPFWHYFLNPINLEFSLGILAAVAVLRGRGSSSAAMLIGAAISLVAFVALGAHREHSLLFGLSIALGLVPLCRRELAGRLRAAGWLVLLGNASYAIYLVHGPLVSVATRLQSAATDSWAVSVLLGLALSTAAGIAYHWRYEQAAMKVIRPPKYA